MVERHFPPLVIGAASSSSLQGPETVTQQTLITLLKP